jgi:hypothetical protein
MAKTKLICPMPHSCDLAMAKSKSATASKLGIKKDGNQVKNRLKYLQDTILAWRGIYYQNVDEETQQAFEAMENPDEQFTLLQNFMLKRAVTQAETVGRIGTKIFQKEVIDRFFEEVTNEGNFLKESIEYLSTVFLSIVDTYRQVNETPEDVIRRLTPSAMFRQCYNTLCRLYGTERNKENDPEAQEFATKLMKLIQNFPMYVAVSLKELETWTYAPVTKLVMGEKFSKSQSPNEATADKQESSSKELKEQEDYIEKLLIDKTAQIEDIVTREDVPKDHWVEKHDEKSVHEQLAPEAKAFISSVSRRTINLKNLETAIYNFTSRKMSVEEFLTSWFKRPVKEIPPQDILNLMFSIMEFQASNKAYVAKVSEGKESELPLGPVQSLEYKKNRFGVTEHLDYREVSDDLLGICAVASDSDEMLKLLAHRAARELIDYVKNDGIDKEGNPLSLDSLSLYYAITDPTIEHAKTLLFSSFKYNQLDYSKTEEKTYKKDGNIFKKFKTIILNIFNATPFNNLKYYFDEDIEVQTTSWNIWSQLGDATYSDPRGFNSRDFDYKRMSYIPLYTLVTEFAKLDGSGGLFIKGGKYLSSNPEHRTEEAREALEESINIMALCIDALGFPINKKQFRNLMLDPSRRGDAREIMNALRETVQSLKNVPEIRPIVTKINKAIKSGKQPVSPSNKEMPLAKDVFSSAIDSDGRNVHMLQSKLKKLSNTLTTLVSRSYKSYVRVKNRKGKTVTMSVHVTPSFLGQRIAKIQSFVRADDAKGLQSWLYEEFGQNELFLDKDDERNREALASGRIENLVYRNEILNRLHQSGNNENQTLYKTFADEFRIARDMAYTTDGKDRVHEEIYEAEDFKAILTGVFSMGEYGRNDLGIYPFFVLGDSGARKTMVSYREMDIEVLKNQMFQIYLQEVRRRNQQEVLQEAIAEVTKGKTTLLDFGDKDSAKNRFYYCTFLNDAKIQRKYSDRFGGVWSLTFKEFKEELENFLENELDAAKAKLIELNTWNDIQGFLEEQAKKEEIRDKKDENGGPKHKQLFRLFLLNYKVNMAYQLQLFAVDPSYYGSIETLQKRYKGIHSPGRVLDMAATWGLHRVGKKNLDGSPAWTKEDAYIFSEKNGGRDQRVVYFEDVKKNMLEENMPFMRTVYYAHAKDKIAASEKLQDPDYLLKATDNEIREALTHEGYIAFTKFKATSSTDGQGYRSFESYRKIMIGTHQWSDRRERVYQRIQEINDSVIAEGRDMTQTEYDYIRKHADPFTGELFIESDIFTPLKPFIYTQEKFVLNGDTNEIAHIPVQIKYAEIVTIPCMHPKGSKMREIAKYMRDFKIDLACSTECIKNGAFGAIDIHHLEEGVSISDKLADAYVHPIPYQDMLIQTNAIENVYADKIFGTQSRKLSMSGINLHSTRYSKEYFNGKDIALRAYDGKTKMTGKATLQLYNELICANILDSIDLFVNIFVKKDKKGEITNNVEILKRTLIENAQNAGKDFMTSLLSFALTGDDTFVLTLLDPETNFESVALLLSILRNNTIKQKILGGSLVAASDFGIREMREEADLKAITSEDGTNLLYNECQIPFNFHYIDKFGDAVHLEYNDWCNQDGTLILYERAFDTKEEFQKFLDNNFITGGYDRRSAEEYIPWKKDGKWYIPKIDLIFPGILDIYGYRTPTERFYSTVKLKAVRFSRPEEGGIIKTSADITARMDSDMDFDKIMMIRKNFVERKLTQDEVKQLWEGLYYEYPEIREQLKKIQKYQESILPKEERKEKLYQYWDFKDKDGISVRDLPAVGDRSSAEFFDYYKDKQAIDYKYLRFEEYDTDKPADQNTQEARDNMLHHIIMKRMSDPETLRDRLTTGGFPNVEDAAEHLRLLTGVTDQNPDVTSVSTLVDYTQKAQIAAQLVGLFANHNSNHFLVSLLEEFQLNTSIKFGDHCDSGLFDFKNELGSIQINQLIGATLDAVKNPMLGYLNINRHTASAAALLARLGCSFVEIGVLFNQPIIIEACRRATNSGFSFSSVISEMVNSEEYASLYKKVKKTYSGMLSTEKLEKIIKDSVKSKQVKPTSTEEGEVRTIYMGTTEEQLATLMLMRQILNEAENLNDFITLTKFSSANTLDSTSGEVEFALEEAMGILKQWQEKPPFKLTIAYDENGQKITIPISTEETLEMLKEGKKAEYLKRISSYSPFAYEQVFFDVMRFSQELIGRYLNTNKSDAIAETKNRLMAIANTDNISGDLRNKLNREMIMMVAANIPGSVLSGNALVNIFDYTKDEATGETTETDHWYFSRDYFQNIFPSHFTNWVEKYRREVALTGASSPYNESYLELLEKFSTKTVLYYSPLLGRVVSRMELSYEPRTTDSDELENDKAIFQAFCRDPKTTDIAKGLLLYSYYMNGFGFTPKGFIQLFDPKFKSEFEIVPERVEEDGTVTPAITYSYLLNNFNSFADKFLSKETAYQQFMLNHLDSPEFVTMFRGKAAKILLDQFGEVEPSITESSTVKFRYNAYPILNRLWKSKPNLQSVGAVEVMPIIAVEDTKTLNIYTGESVTYNRYFMHVPDPGYSFGLGGKSITYKEVFPTGRKNVSVQYFSGTQGEVSSPALVPIRQSDTYYGVEQDDTGKLLQADQILDLLNKQAEDMEGETAEEIVQSILEAGLKEQKVIPVINELGELSKICM